MGDRGIVVFKAGEHISPAVYVHWHGENLPELLREAAPTLRANDPDYAAARFCGHVANKAKGKTGVGIFNTTTLADVRDREFSHGDAGVVIVDVGTGEIEAINGYLSEREFEKLHLTE
jgi:hypothetical protein